MNGSLRDLMSITLGIHSAPLVEEPYRVDVGEPYHAGSVIGEPFIPGTKEGETYRAGSVLGELFIPGRDTGEPFMAGSVIGETAITGDEDGSSS